MGSFCTGKPAVQTTNQTQSYTPDAGVAASGRQVLDMAGSAASRPFEMPAAPVAGFNPFQQQAFSQYQGMQGGTDPYFQNAAAGMERAGQPVTQQEIASYMNPYADQALASMKKYVFDPQRRNTMGSAVQTAGGVGADRLALTSQNLDKTQADALSGAQAGFYSNAMQQAQRAKEMALTSGQGWANLGIGRQGAQLQATGALAGAGSQQQAQTQRELMSPYQQRLAEIAYPMQQASFLSGITGDMSNVFKGTQTSQGTTTSQAAQASPMNQIIGLGMAGAGLMMGNPMGAMSMFGGMGGGGGQYDRSNPMNNYAAFGPTYFAEGGSVSPYDIGEGFDEGGFADRWQAVPDAINSGEFDPQGMNYNPSAYGLTRMAPGEAQNPFSGITLEGGTGFKQPQGPMPSGAMGWDDLNAPIQPKPVATESINPPASPARPQITVNPMSRPAQPPQPARRPQMVPVQPEQFSPRPTPDPSINGEVAQDGLFMPKSLLPYPDATDRDWGQKMTRSPWMSLVTAGAKMAQSTKSGAAGLAEGIEAGAGHLDKQRKELRSEEQINQRAEALYRQSKAELDKYTKMTPYQKAITEGEKYQWLPGTGIDPETNKVVQGAYRLPTKGGEAPVFVPNAAITKGGAGDKPTALQKNIEYLVSSGILGTKEEAFKQLRQSVRDRDSFVRLVQAQEKILKDDLQWMNRDPAERHAEAQRVVRAMQQFIATQDAP